MKHSLFLFGLAPLLLVINTADASVQESAYIIPDEILYGTVEDCRDLLLDDDGSLDSQQVTEIRFNAAVCLYHVLRDSSESEQISKAIQLFRQVQARGLENSQQALANLLEGLLHCRIAKNEYNPGISLQNTMFCANRRLAQASLAELDSVLGASFDYQEGSAYVLEDLISGIEGCYAGTDGILSSNYNMVCSQPERISDDRLRAIADEVFDALHTKYFASAESPITAMFVRKKKMAESVLGSANTKISFLTGKSDALDSAVSSIEGFYNQHIESPLSELVQAYIQTLSISSAILNTYDSWKRGLFVDVADNNRNYEDLLNTRAEKIRQAAESLSDVATLIEQAKVAYANVSIQQAQLLSDGRKMCRLYHCGLASHNEWEFFFGYYYQDACNRIVNPLCTNQDGMMTTPSQEDFSAADFCAESAFNTNYQVVGLSESEANACWQALLQ